MIIKILNRYDNSVIVERESTSLKDLVIACVAEKVNLQGANLQGADLRYADLQDANLQGADLYGAYLADGVKATAGPARRATRADGYEFFLWPTDAGWRVKAGCRFFTMDEAWRHWEAKRGNTPLGDESLDILTMFELHIQRNGNP